jgi:hypothetical protein
MINSDQIHVAMTKMRGRVATPVCQSNILLKQGTVKGERERERRDEPSAHRQCCVRIHRLDHVEYNRIRQCDAAE